jgi:glycosyltransferase involved in cell wall biosynthesis
MKIAVDCRMIGSGGIGTYISELIPWFLKKNQCMLLGTHEQCMSFLRRENVEFCYCDTPPFSLDEMFSFPKDILGQINHCDVFYTPYCNIPGGISIPIYATIHDVVFLDMKGLTSLSGKIARKWFYQRAVNLSRKIFTVSEFSKSRILHTLSCKKPVIVGYNGIPSWISEPSETIPEKNDTILFVGNIKPHKGLHTLLQAFRKVHDEGLPARLVIAGNAENFRTGDSETLREIRSVPEGSITFTGKISNEKLKMLYMQSNLLVQPSLYEGFGIPPLEALSCKTNVIMSDIPVFHEIYDGFPVIFFKCGDSNDLAVKITQQYNALPPQAFPDRYSYKNTADILMKAMEGKK